MNHLVQHDALFGGVPLVLRMGIIALIMAFIGYKISGGPGAVISVLFVAALTIGVPMGRTVDQKAHIQLWIFIVTMVLMICADHTPSGRAAQKRMRQRKGRQ